MSGPDPNEMTSTEASGSSHLGDGTGSTHPLQTQEPDRKSRPSKDDARSNGRPSASRSRLSANADAVEPVASGDTGNDDPEKGSVQGLNNAADGGAGPASSSGGFMSKLRKRMGLKRQSASDAWNMPAPYLKNPDSYPHGYPRLAAHIDSETNTHLYRRFGYLRTRSLLYLQDELVYMERQLHAMDLADAEEEHYRLFERNFDVEDDPKRQILFTKINAKLQEYDEMLLRQRDMLALRKASTRDWQYHARYLWGRKPLSPEDMEFIWNKGDIVDLYTYAESTWMRPMVEAFVSLLPSSVLTFIFRKKRKTIDANNNNNTAGNSSPNPLDATTQSLIDGRLELVFKIVIVLLTVILLLVPVALLYLLTVSAWWKLVIIFIFIALFTIVTLFLTQAKRNEVFVSVATYTAVLVVFLGNLPSPTASS